jgi:hypothetical protein
MAKAKKSEIKPVIVKVDKKLDKYLEINAFQDKLDKANEILRASSLPPVMLQ